MIDKSPPTFPMPYRKSERDRVLSDDELTAVYRAAEELAYSAIFRPFGFIILFCIHTGMRRSEVAALKWSYLTSDLITIPPQFTKNGKQHALPNLVYHFLALVPRKSEYLFASPSTQQSPSLLGV